MTTSEQFAIIPQPLSITRSAGEFLITPDTVISADEEAETAAGLLADWLAAPLGGPLPVVGQALPADRRISLRLDEGVARLGPEGYHLTVEPERIAIRAAGPAGLFYGAQTLRQLLPLAAFAGEAQPNGVAVPAVEIEDTPRFPWRGLMLDVARHFMPKDDVLRLLDVMALHKLNTFHFHLTDDQGWRIEVKKYPRLTEVGAWRKETMAGHYTDRAGYDGTPHGGFYTQDELREIVAYAAARSITVVPEVEIPGHAQAAIAAYPEFGVTGEAPEVQTGWGIFPYLYSPDEKSMQFLKDVLVEVMEIFPSPYIHVGGDEAIKDQWRASPTVQAQIAELGLAGEEELQSWFLAQIGAFLAEHGRRMVGWDEIVEGGVPGDATVMSWRGIDGGLIAARQGYDVIMSPRTSVYLDYYQSHDPSEPVAIGGYVPLEKVYSFDPVPEELSADEAARVVGSQAMLWREYIPTTEHAHLMLFPRLCALAEVVWTAPEKKDYADFLRRLAVHEQRLAALGIRGRPVALLADEASFSPRPDPWENFNHD